MLKQAISQRLSRDSSAWIAGVFMPIAMVLLDPAVFRTQFAPFVSTPFLGPFKPLGYVGITMGVGAVLADLLMKGPSAFRSGMLVGAAAFAILLGIVLLPFSFIGAFVAGIGLLGLSPFVSAAVICFRARKAWKAAPPDGRLWRALFALALFVGVCATAQASASAALSRATQEISSPQEDVRHQGVARLRRWRLLLDLDQLISVWLFEEDAAKKEGLSVAFRQLTGESIETQAADFVD